MDHIPIAVSDLESAARRFEELGFTLKPGRHHDNGIRNRHAKFRDGTELELITAGNAVDSLTTQYVRHLASGDGPAFVALYAPDLDLLGGLLSSAGIAFRREGGVLSVRAPDALRHFFFALRNASPTDKPGHFEHRNTAEALVSVWLASDDFGAERALLETTGATLRESIVYAPDRVRASVAEYREGSVLLLPAARRSVPGRCIIGATLRVRSLEALRHSVRQNSWRVPGEIAVGRARSLFLPPGLTHGIWLEFREESQD